jgi:hypothetical protein
VSDTCTSDGVQAISNFLRQEGGTVRLERDCNACAAGAIQHAQQQLQHSLGGWPAAAAASLPELPTGLRHNPSSAALLAQLSSVLQGHMQAQQQQRHQQVRSCPGVARCHHILTRAAS